MPRGPARDAGLRARHAAKEARVPITCRYIDLVPGGLCRDLAVADGPIRLCAHHLELALTLARQHT